MDSAATEPSAMDRAAMERLCDDWFAAWTGNQPERLLAHYSQDCSYVDPARPAGLRGHAELRPYFTKLLAANPDGVWTRRELHPLAHARGFVVLYEATIPIPGKETLVERGMDLVTLDDAGRIARNEVFFDLSRWLARLGRAPR